jgi:prevent-host-death family protein
LTVYIWFMGPATAAARTVRTAEDIVPISEFKAGAAEMLRRIAETGHPLVITQNGKAAGVILSPAEFDRLNERARFVAAVEEGLADADAGRVREHDEVVARMSERFRATRVR